ncbi:MAG: response regulator [Bryobacterales bacterium]|nr:response regulator [Bryobacterales bacterium]MEB2361599.1 response regulator [Bryobacterales bacterium]
MTVYPSARILVVDDEEPIRRLLCECLSASGYEVAAAGNGAIALSLLMMQPFDLVVSDVRMPVLDGIGLLEQVSDRGLDVSFILLTACGEVALAVKAMRMGAADYVLKPFSPVEISGNVRRALEQRQEARTLKTLVNEQEAKIGRFARKLEEASEDMLELLVAALDAREENTRHHSKRVSEYAVSLSRRMGLDSPEIELIRKGALLHDVGKIGVRDSILLKPGELDNQEWDEMRRHPEVGYSILNCAASLRPAADMVLKHHAHYDGNGYPGQWSGEEIPLGARIFSVVDCFDAMTSDRPYRRAVSYEDAKREIVRCAGTQFDPLLVKYFLKTDPGELDSIHNRFC